MRKGKSVSVNLLAMKMNHFGIHDIPYNTIHAILKRKVQKPAGVKMGAW